MLTESSGRRTHSGYVKRWLKPVEDVKPFRVGQVVGERLLPRCQPAQRCHMYRHTRSGIRLHRWLVGGGDVFTLSKILGHASVAVTEKHYAHLLRENIQAKADLVDLGLGLPAVKGKVIAMNGREVWHFL
jgi:integrase